ncbi:MAG: wax ester/triacylglycerol synthase family O-acyltransferase, partial [Halioglobus sp.]|nr:wax ester/triacylglycerol synthase family O-acyltransferase [Halioglobus sp.]
MMKRIPLIDDAFLRLESRNQPLHIGVLMMLDPGPKAADDYAAKLVARLRRSEGAAELFNQRLADKRGAHYWEDSPDFDLDHHFVHLALPRPGRIRELFDMVSRLHSSHLDRAFPLWRVYLIEGIEDGRIALYMKVHHAMVDGVGGMEMLLGSMSTSRAESRKMPPLWETKRRRKQKKVTPVVPAPALADRIRVRSVTMDSWRAAMPVISKLRKTFQDFDAHNPDVALAGEAPKCVFNEPISGTRRFSAQSYSRPRIKRVAAAINATSNDIVLAMVAGALRRYLEARGELPDKPLTAGVPISIRNRSGGSDAGNQVAFAISNLATHIDDPIERMRAIKRSMDYNKGQLQGLSSGQIQAYSSLSTVPGAVNVLLGRKPGNTLGNAVVSNIPGPA